MIFPACDADTLPATNTQGQIQTQASSEKMDKLLHGANLAVGVAVPGEG